MRFLTAFQKLHYTAVLLVLGAAVPAPVLAQSLSPQTLPQVAPQEPTSFGRYNQDAVINPAAVDHPNYTLGPGDQIGIVVYGYEEFTEQKVVLSDGTVVLPLIGSVRAAGMTTDEFERDLETRLNEYLVDPSVTITLNTLRPLVVNVAGEVQRPGPVRLRGLTTTTGGGQDPNAQLPTVTTALVQAGGVTRLADIRSVVLTRYNPNGNSTPITLNLWDSIMSESAPPDLVLQDGDTIYVPQLTAGDTLDRRVIARSSLAPATVRVRVVGEVVNPGEVQVPPNDSVSSAVAIAGGPTEDARLARVQFIRLNDQGQIEQTQLDLRNLTDSYQIQEGDVIIVPKKGSSSLLDFAARVLNPFNSLFNILDNF